MAGAGPPRDPGDEPDEPDRGDEPGGVDPFKGIPFFGDLARLIQQQGPVSWDAARQLALSIATGGEPEPNVDPLERMKLEQLARVAELQVANATGLSTSITGRGVTLVPVNRTQWLQRSLDDQRPLFERLARALSGSVSGGLSGGAADEGTGDEGPIDDLFGGILQMLGPMMLGMTAGSMLGHLSRRTFGQYDLPIPRPPSDDLLLCVPNLDEFGEAWSLPPDDLRLWVCLHEVCHHAVIGVPHVRARLEGLLQEYVSSFEAAPNAFEDRLAGIDFGDPSSFEELQRSLGDPDLLMGAIESDRQRELLPRLDALVAVIVGYVDHVMDEVGTSLIASYGMLTEALRRRRVEADPSDRFVHRLLGLSLDQPQYDRGERFIGGVVERAGPGGLERLWKSERELPTPAEVDAPGLWLARIDLPEE